jgi:hypothetical protein
LRQLEAGASGIGRFLSLLQLDHLIQLAVFERR